MLNYKHTYINASKCTCTGRCQCWEKTVQHATGNLCSCKSPNLFIYLFLILFLVCALRNLFVRTDTFGRLSKRSKRASNHSTHTHTHIGMYMYLDANRWWRPWIGDSGHICVYEGGCMHPHTHMYIQQPTHTHTHARTHIFIM